MVYHGHIGHELLWGIGHVLKVLLTAPMSFRIEQVRGRQTLTDAAALHCIEEIDKAHSRRLMAMFGADWRDPNRYDHILNMGKMTREGAKRVILEAAGLTEYQPTAKSTHAFKNLALGSRVHATLISSTSIRGSALEVRADDGHIHVKGRVDHEAMADKVEKLVLNLRGVSRVTNDLYSVPSEPV